MKQQVEPNPIPHTTKQMITHLLYGNWMNSKRLYQSGLFSDMSLSNARRHMRECAENSQGMIISGQRGYKLTKQASQDEVHHCHNRLRKQARLMRHRADEIMNYFYDR